MLKTLKKWDLYNRASSFITTNFPKSKGKRMHWLAGNGAAEL